MDFSNPSLWQLVYLQSLNSEFFGTLQLPIAAFDTPAIAQKIIRLKISSATGKPNWVRAGNASQIINAGNVQSSVKNIPLILNQDQVIFLEPFTPYFLRFGLPKYFTQANISIFGYAGVTVDSSQPFLLGL